MALIKCAECGKEISDSAERCPNCGCTTRAGNDKAELKGLGIGGLIGIILLVLGLIVLFKGYIFAGIGMTVGGIVDMVSASNKIKQFDEQKAARDRAMANGWDGKEWQCTCGKVNAPDAEKCSCCSKSRVK